MQSARLSDQEAEVCTPGMLDPACKQPAHRVVRNQAVWPFEQRRLDAGLREHVGDVRTKALKNLRSRQKGADGECRAARFAASLLFPMRPVAYYRGKPQSSMSENVSGVSEYVSLDVVRVC